MAKEGFAVIVEDGIRLNHLFATRGQYSKKSGS